MRRRLCAKKFRRRRSRYAATSREEDISRVESHRIPALSRAQRQRLKSCVILETWRNHITALPIVNAARSTVLGARAGLPAEHIAACGFIPANRHARRCGSRAFIAVIARAGETPALQACSPWFLANRHAWRRDKRSSPSAERAGRPRSQRKSASTRRRRTVSRPGSMAGVLRTAL